MEMNLPGAEARILCALKQEPVWVRREKVQNSKGDQWPFCPPRGGHEEEMSAQNGDTPVSRKHQGY
jgi:hypothetical protein